MTLLKDLDEYEVLEPGMWENDQGPEGWYAVTNSDGIIAYFAKEDDAYSFRMSLIRDSRK